VGKKIADIWKGLPENEKEGYKQRAGQAKAEYDQLNPKQPKQARCAEPRRRCLPSPWAVIAHLGGLDSSPAIG